MVAPRSGGLPTGEAVDMRPGGRGGPGGPGGAPGGSEQDQLDLGL